MTAVLILLAERGLDLSYETIRRWVSKFGPLLANELRRRRHRLPRNGTWMRVCREGFRSDVVAELHGR
jgi:transposase-like protein